MTQACFRYENFVKNNPVASSRVTSPVNNYERNIQGRPIQKPQYTSGRQNTAHFPRFQPPIVPGELPKTSYPTQREVRSNQDVRNDPQFNGGAAHHGQTKQKMGMKTQKYVKQPIDINEVCLEDNQRQQQEQQHWEEQILQLQREESLRKEKKENSTRIVQGVLKPKKENSAYEDRTAESKIAQIIREMDRPVFVNHYYAVAADTLPQVTRPTKTVYVVDGIEHSIHSAKVTQTTEKLTRDAAAQVAQDECIEHSIQPTQNLETAQRRLREAEKIQQIQGQNYGAYQTIQTYPVMQGPLVVEPTGPNTSNAKRVKSSSAAKFFSATACTTDYNTNRAGCSTIGTTDAQSGYDTKRPVNNYKVTKRSRYFGIHKGYYKGVRRPHQAECTECRRKHHTERNLTATVYQVTR